MNRFETVQKGITRTLVITRNEVLRARPATKMPGYVALEIARPRDLPLLWHVVKPEEVVPRAKEWAESRGVSVVFDTERGLKCQKPTSTSEETEP